jgi:hypothetical protein
MRILAITTSEKVNITAKSVKIPTPFKKLNT